MISSGFIIQGRGGQSCRIISDKRQGGKMRKTKFCAKALAVSLVLAFAWSCSSGEKPPLLGKETVKGWLSDPEVIILDVREPKDWNVSDKKIKGAVRQDPDEVKIWAADLPKNKKIVLY
jgi:hypothetical protein